MQLIDLLKKLGVSQASLCRELEISDTSMWRLTKYSEPIKTGTAAFLKKLRAALCGHGASEEEAAAVLATLKKPEPTTKKAAPAAENQNQNEEEILMALRHHSLTQQARQAFGLFRDPFIQPERPEEVFMSPSIRYAREALYQAATHGNFMALIGESGSGKSTLRRELIERLNRDCGDVIVIQPYVLTMSTRDNGAGKPLRTSHIIEAILAAIEPSTSISSSPEVLARRVHEALKRSSRAGNRHVLIIEEAHDLHSMTLKALKRFYELEDGMRRLLSIILIGQSELGLRLSTAAADVREVVQRIDVVNLPPLDDVEAFLRHRFKAAGLDADAVFDKSAYRALADRLMVSRDNRGAAVNMAYPLPVCNLATACINEAAALGFEKVDAEMAELVKL